MKRRVHYRRKFQPWQLRHELHILRWLWNHCQPMMKGLPREEQIAVLMREGYVAKYQEIHDTDPIIADRAIRGHGFVSVPAPEFGPNAVTLKLKSELTGAEVKVKRNHTRKRAGMYVSVANEERAVVAEKNGEQLPLLFLLEQAM